ncbi:alpha/beta hydrolase [Paraburkholderia sp. EG286B]|uniref:alpha/beta hydrolase n=1 Tax=Paraburkholderia sp. EG286B TaxID=3237011 RepID=UPI0034D31326
MAFSAVAASQAVPLAAIAAAAVALVKGGPRQPEPLESINAPFKEVDFSDLPALRRYTARDGASLAWRAYLPQAGAPHACVVLIHGSSASSASLHPLARQFAATGYTACVPDIRGHGESGRKGTIACSTVCASASSIICRRSPMRSRPRSATNSRRSIRST